MAAVNESSTTPPTPRRRQRLLWPRFESEQDLDRHLRAIRKILFAVVLFGVGCFGLLLWLSPDRFQARFPEGVAVALLVVGGSAYLTGGTAWLLPTRRSRVLAVLLTGCAGWSVVDLLANIQLPVYARIIGAAFWALMALMALGAIRGTWRWHADRGSRIDWGHTAIAVAVPTLAATTIALLLIVVILVLEEMSAPVDPEGEAAAVVVFATWLITWTALAVALTWHLPTVYSGRGASG